MRDGTAVGAVSGAVLPLRASGNRPRSGAAEQRDELAAPHSITSSASCWRCKGTSRPSALALDVRVARVAGSEALGDVPQHRFFVPQTNASDEMSPRASSLFSGFPADSRYHGWRSSPRQSCSDCIIATRGYSFREGQPARSRPRNPGLMGKPLGDTDGRRVTRVVSECADHLGDARLDRRVCSE